MGGFRNALNNKPQRKMRPTLATYKQPAFATEIDAYMGKENSSDTVTINGAGNGFAVFESSHTSWRYLCCFSYLNIEGFRLTLQIS